MRLKTLANLGRFKEIVAVFTRYGFADVVCLLDIPGCQIAEHLLEHSPQSTPYERFRMALDELGPTFVKFGQVMSLRSDLLPKPLLEELQKLQDHASQVDFESIRQVIDKNLAQPSEDLFLTIDVTPIAAASLSQVHRAVLRQGSTEVALKVQRPGIEEKIERDLSILASIADQIHERMAEMRIYDLPGLVSLMRRSLEHELDFRREARYLQVARRHMADIDGIHVPGVYPDFSTPQLLVMEFVHGENLKGINRVLLEDPAALARTGLRAAVKQLFEVGFFHADPHPGNVLISDGNIINILDWGMVGRLTPRDRNEMVDVFAAIVGRDSEGLVDALLTVTDAAAGIEVDRPSLERRLLDMLDTHLIASLSELRLGQLVAEIMAVMREYQLRLPPDLFMMIKAFVTVEGTVKLIHPEMDLVAEIRPHLERLALRRFNPELAWRGVRAFIFRLAASPARFPKRVADLFQKMEQGRLRIGFDHRNLEGLLKTLEKTFSRLTMGVILGAIIIGSSLIITTGIPPLLYGYPLLGLVGYLISAAFGLWVIFDIMRNR